MQASIFLQKLKTLDTRDISDLHGIGDVLAQNLYNFVNSSRFKRLLAKFEELESQGKGVNIQNTNTPQIQGKLTGQTICITGTFETPRSNIKNQLEEIGAKVVENITAKTTILLAGDQAGTKLSKAKKLGIKIVEELAELVN